MKGPRWLKDAAFGVTQADSTGERWQVQSVSSRGRIIKWISLKTGLSASSEIVKGHPDFVSDEDLAEAAAKARAAKRRRK